MAIKTKFTTVIEVLTKGFDKLKNSGSSFNNINQAAKKSTAAVDMFGSAMGKRFPKNVAKGGTAISSFGKRIGMLGNVFGKVRGVMRGLSGAISAVIGFKVISEITQLVNQAQSLSNKLKVVSKDAKDLSKNFAAMGEVARNTRADLDGTITMFQRLTFASSRLGASTEQVATVTENVNKLMAIQGVMAHEARSVLLQLSQGFQSGKLAGDEFRAISETLPPILDILAKETGRTREELKKLASEGFLKPRLILNALLKETQNIDKQFRKTSITLAQGMNLIKTELIMFTAEFMEMEFIKDLITVVFRGISKVMEIFGTAVNAVIKAVDVLYVTLKRLLTFDIQAVFDDLNAAMFGVSASALKLRRDLRGMERVAQELNLTTEKTLEEFEGLEIAMTKVNNQSTGILDFFDKLSKQGTVGTIAERIAKSFNLMGVGSRVVKDRMIELKSIMEHTSIPMAGVETALNKGALAFKNLGAEQEKLAHAQSGGSFGNPFEMFGSDSDRADKLQEMKDTVTQGYAFILQNGQITFAAINEGNIGLMEGVSETILTTQEEISAGFIRQEELNRAGVTSAAEFAKSTANAYLFTWEGTFAALQGLSKSAWSAFSNGAATAFTSVIMGQEKFGKAMKKMIVQFARSMVMELIKVALAMIAIKAIAGMGFDPSKLTKIMGLSGSIASSLLSAEKGGGGDAPKLATGGIVTSPTLAMIGEGGEPEAVVPLSKADDMGFGGGQPMVIQNLSIFPNANLDAALLDRPQSYWVDLVQEKILPALNDLGSAGSTISVEFQETR